MNEYVDNRNEPLEVEKKYSNDEQEDNKCKSTFRSNRNSRIKHKIDQPAAKIRIYLTY